MSTSGFVLQLPGQQAVLVTSAAAVYPLLQQQRRRQLLAGATHADLVPGSQLHAQAELASDRRSSRASSSSSSSSSVQPVELRLVGLAELPGVRHALARLLAAPSIAGPGGWQVGWLLHRLQLAQPLVNRQLGRAPWGAGNGGTGGSAAGSPVLEAAAAPAAAAGVDMLEVACQVAVLLPVCAEGATALSRLALPWPGLHSSSCTSDTCRPAVLRQGQQVAAVGAPFGALSSQHFSGFVSCGVISSAIFPISEQQQREQREQQQQPGGQPGGGSVSGGGCSTTGQPALLLSDLRCAPGMEGAPVFATPQATDAAGPGIPAAVAAGGEEAAQPLGALAGMLLPPLKSPSAQVELALVVPASGVALAVEAALQLAGHSFLLPFAPAAGCRAAAAATAAAVHPVAAAAPAAAGCSAAAATAAAEAAPSLLSEALRSVVAVVNGGAWATGVVISSGGHILTNAHLLEAPQLPGLHLPSSSRSSSSSSSRGPGGSSASSSSQGRGAQAGGQQAGAEAPTPPSPALPHPPVRVLLPSAGGSGSSGGTWATADALYVFTGPLDLAVLQLRQQPVGRQLPAWRAADHSRQLPAWRPAEHTTHQPPAWRAADHSRQLPALHQAEHSTHQPPVWRAAELSSQPPRAGQRVCVAGFPAFNPRGGVLGAVVTAGTLAKVVHLPAGGPPAMLLTTAAVHSGASGGAVLDAATGQLCGLVTSNAKHSSRSGAGRNAGGGGAPAGVQTVLPHINFSIPAAQLRPLVVAAQAAADAAVGARSSGSSAAAAEAAAASALAAWRALDAAGEASLELQQVWQLDRQRQRPGQLQPDEAQQGAGGMFGGATPPAKLQQLLHTLQQQQQQQQQEEQREKQQRPLREEQRTPQMQRSKL